MVERLTLSLAIFQRAAAGGRPGARPCTLLVLLFFNRNTLNDIERIPLSLAIFQPVPSGAGNTQCAPLSLAIFQLLFGPPPEIRDS